MAKITQEDIACLLGKTQMWVSRRQRRAADPMPKGGVDAVMAWAARNGVGSSVAPTPAAGADLPADTDARLKTARTEKLRLEVGALSGEMLWRADVESAQVRRAVEFRTAVGDMARQIRNIVDRHASTTTADAVCKDLEDAPAQLLSMDKSLSDLADRAIARTALLLKVEEIVACQ